MTEEERKQLNRDRQRGVRMAWEREKALVQEGKGTRDWSLEEQKELLEKGYVKGYEGQHMRSVSLDPSQAANPDNVQFLSHENHLDAHNQAGGQGYLSPTNGYYDESTHTLNSFAEGEAPHLNTINLSNAYCKSEEYQMAQKQSQEQKAQQEQARAANREVSR